MCVCWTAERLSWLRGRESTATRMEMFVISGDSHDPDKWTLKNGPKDASGCIVFPAICTAARHFSDAFHWCYCSLSDDGGPTRGGGLYTS